MPATAADVSGNKCELEISQGEAVERLSILFGDVWFCSGQSNMERPLLSVFDSREEIIKTVSELKGDTRKCSVLFKGFLVPDEIQILKYPHVQNGRCHIRYGAQ